MKKILKTILIIILVLCVATVGTVYYFKKAPVEIEEEQIDPNRFVWGVNTSAYQIDGYYPETADKQVDVIKKLGVNTVRMTLERTLKLDPYSIVYDEKSNDDFIDKLDEADLDVSLILDGDIIGTAGTSVNQERKGYELGSYAASRYKGKVKYYQIANEVTGTVVKPSDPDFDGEVTDGALGLQYSVDRYNSALGWLKGMARGIRANDPDAEIVVSGHWILYDIIERLIDDGLDCDIIGWAWYSEDGLDITQSEFEGQNINVFKELNSLGKKVWIVESNRHQGSHNEEGLSSGEGEQAKFIQDFIESNIDSGLFRGYVVYTLFDTPGFIPNIKEQDSHWGLSSVGKDKAGRPIFREKEAYYAYQTIIENYLSI